VIPVVGGSNPLGHPTISRRAGQPARVAFAPIARDAVAQISANARGMLSSSDPEYLHRLRVGFRRLRAALRAFRGVLPGSKRRRLIRALRKLSPVLGAARDWDVLLARTNVDARAYARARRARKAAAAAVASKDFARVLAMASALEADEDAEPAADFAARALERAHRKVMKRAKGVDWSHAARRHAVRIRVKRLRYTCELFAAAFPGAAARSYISALKALQGVLGELNDLSVARCLVGAHADEAPLLRELDVAWERFARRRAFWRARG
jgi:triphosphatase